MVTTGIDSSSLFPIVWINNQMEIIRYEFDYLVVD